MKVLDQHLRIYLNVRDLLSAKGMLTDRRRRALAGPVQAELLVQGMLRLANMAPDRRLWNGSRRDVVLGARRD